jgi:hypothetical protein
MARVHELIQPHQDTLLRHPIVGTVVWREPSPGVGRILVFAEGPERNKPLVVDDAVLWSNDWRLLEPGDSADPGSPSSY